ncbi:MAG: hypothetical protein FJY99_06020 [Candidatus Sericytochromatia bacterium]|nr:hypothetical protein [Candidatus Tanganyikabacteria bacterium]
MTPWVAALMPRVATLANEVAASQVYPRGFIGSDGRPDWNASILTSAVVRPLALGSGHLLAGDSGRATWVGLGAAVASAVASTAFEKAALSAYKPAESRTALDAAMIYLSAGVYAGVHAAVAWDAWRTAEGFPTTEAK